jgi:hypothetical protein
MISKCLIGLVGGTTSHNEVWQKHKETLTKNRVFPKFNILSKIVELVCTLWERNLKSKCLICLVGGTTSQNEVWQKHKETLTNNRVFPKFDILSNMFELVWILWERNMRSKCLNGLVGGTTSQNEVWQKHKETLTKNRVFPKMLKNAHLLYFQPVGTRLYYTLFTLQIRSVIQIVMLAYRFRSGKYWSRRVTPRFHKQPKMWKIILRAVYGRRIEVYFREKMLLVFKSKNA